MVIKKTYNLEPIITAKYETGMSFSEIARESDLSISAVKRVFGRRQGKFFKAPKNILRVAKVLSVDIKDVVVNAA